MRKTMMVAAAAVMASFGAAAAADLGDYGGSTKDGPVAYGPATSWAGLYVGASAGYAWGEGGHSYDGGDEVHTTDLDGAVYGVHVGYNIQRGNIVLGAEASFNSADMDGSIDGGRPSTELDWYSTGVARLGYAVSDTLVYGFGGVAWGDVTYAYVPSTSDETQIGWTAGFGVEHALSDRVSIRLEYSHVDLGGEDTFTDICDDCEGDASFDAALSE